MSLFGRRVLTVTAFTVAGTVPGVVTDFCWKVAPGISLGITGAVVGFFFGLLRLSPARLVALASTFSAAQNVPILGSLLFETLHESTEDQQVADAHQSFEGWLLAKGVQKRRGWLVLSGLITGLIAGAIVGLLDIKQLQSGGHGLLLPLSGSRESLAKQAVVASLACAIWTGSLAGILASPAWRRPVGLAVLVSGLAVLNAACFGAIAWGGQLTLVTGFVTVGIAFGLLTGLLGSEDQSEKQA